MRLIDQLAATRIYYPRPLPSLPEILLIDIPPALAGEGLALGRYYPVILESLAEMHEFETFLCEQRTDLVSPSLLARRPSSLRADNIIFARYSPPAPGWPWLQLGCWPIRYTMMTPFTPDGFARGVYTVDAFESAAEIKAAEGRLLAALGPHEARYVQTQAGDGGHA